MSGKFVLKWDRVEGGNPFYIKLQNGTNPKIKNWFTGSQSVYKATVFEDKSEAKEILAKINVDLEKTNRGKAVLIPV
jgi:hypothetical protein